VDIEGLQRQLDEVFDQVVVYHGFVDYMRDYEVIVFVTADPRARAVREGGRAAQGSQEHGRTDAAR
jgi:hypothetical protein